MIIPNLLNPALLAGAGPRGLALPNLMATPNPLSNPALVNQLQQIQRLHAQNSRLIGKLRVIWGHLNREMITSKVGSPPIFILTFDFAGGTMF